MDPRDVLDGLKPVAPEQGESERHEEAGEVPPRHVGHVEPPLRPADCPHRRVQHCGNGKHHTAQQCGKGVEGTVPGKLVQVEAKVAAQQGVDRTHRHIEPGERPSIPPSVGSMAQGDGEYEA